MDRMGSSCSLQKHRDDDDDNPVRNRPLRGASPRRYAPSVSRIPRSLRHSVVSEIPDHSIASLYPLDDNYINTAEGRRSPKSLADLATDALCRHLPLLQGELPAGLPQQVGDGIVQSLIQHSALNATTLRVLRNCELGQLTLAGCRGVCDEWLSHFASDTMEIEMEHEAFYEEGASSSSTSSFVHEVMMDQDRTRTERATDQDLGPAHSRTTTAVTCTLSLLDLRGSSLTDRGLMQFTDLQALQVAKLDNCHALVGRGLLALSLSHHLHTLSLANCRRLTDEAVINISHLVSLENLSLDGCRCLTDRSLAAISDLYGLRKLGLSQCDLITDDGLAQLEHLSELMELSIGWCRQITDRGMDLLTKHRGRDSNLTILRLARCLLTDIGIGHLDRLKALVELDLNGCSRVGSAALGRTLEKLERLSTLDISYCPGILRSGFQGKINNVKTLELCYSGVKDSQLGKFIRLPALQELNLDSCPVGDWAMGHLADSNVVPNLKSLDLADTDLTDLGMVKIAQFVNLTRLSLFYCSITNGGLRHIAKLRNLEVLNLDSREISDDGLRYLSQLKNLKSLDIFSGRITDSGCAHIASIRSLESLELCGGGVGDMGCTALASLDKLSTLNLSQNERITNRGAAALAALTNLKALNLSNTRVNAAALRFFGGLVRLQTLALYGCRGMEESDWLFKLQDDLPNLKCLRLNRALDEDGIVMTDASSDVESSADDMMWTEPVVLDEYSDHD